MIYYSFVVADSLTAVQNTSGDTFTNFRLNFSNLGITYVKYLRIDGVWFSPVGGGVERCDAAVQILYFNSSPAIVETARISNVSPGAAVLNGLDLVADTFKPLHVPEGIPLGNGKQLVVQVHFYGFTPAVEIPSIQANVILGIDNAPVLKSDIISPEDVWTSELRRTTPEKPFP
jgi:hypothetical protein